MKSKSTIRRSMLATLLVFATAALGLQPLGFSSGSSCECNATETSNVQSAVTESSCCSGSAQTADQSCCSAKPLASAKTTTKGCCCNPEATVCKCVDCKCSLGDQDSIPASPAIPTNQTPEAASPAFVCAAPLIGYPRESSQRRSGCRRSAAEFKALSSQQTCVLLSRFTC